MKKVRAELATRVNNLTIQQLLIQLLNSVNSDVQQIQQTPKAQTIKVKAHKEVSLQNVIAEELNDQLLAQTVHDSLNLHMNIKNGQNIINIIIV